MNETSGRPPAGSSSTAHSAGHFALVYRDEAYFIEEVAEFLDSGMRASGSALLIATAAHREAIRDRLRGFGSEGMYGKNPGMLTEFDAAELLDLISIDGHPDRTRTLGVLGGILQHASQNGRRPLHVFGEMVVLLCRQGRQDDAVALEDLWNELSRRHAFSLFCAYPVDAFESASHADAFVAVCAAHHHVVHEPAPGGAGALRRKVQALEAELARSREAERTLRAREKDLLDFVENAVEGLHRVGPDGTILWANKAELRMLGYTHDEYVGQHIGRFHMDAELVEDVMRRLAAGETLHDTPARMRCKDGSVKHVLVSSNGAFVDGQLRHTRCFTRDVSELAQSHAERESLLANLGTALRAKDEFLAMLGHELRNPLAPIVTALHLMKLRGDVKTSKEQEIIRRQVGHLTRLVDDLLDVSRITRGLIELRKESVPLAEVLGKAVEMVNLLMEQRQHRFDVRLPPADLLWNGDPTRLAQVVSNLLNNAARYTPPGGRVELVGAREGGDAVITVRDNGRGIAADVLPRIFDLFFQGARTAERSEGGMGVGLALARSLVEMHGGRIEARSAGPGMGSEFLVRLPLGPAASAQPPPAALAGEPVQASAPRRILVVDDNQDAANLLGELLAARGHELRVAHDPAAALETLRSFVPEVAILDIGLPVMDGYELATQMRNQLRGAELRLFALTGYGQAADRARSERAGFEGHFVKPIEPARLLAAVEGAPAAVR